MSEGYSPADGWSRRQLLVGGAALATLTTGCEALSTDPSDTPADDGRGDKGEQAPELAERVEAGELAPVADRLPKQPLVIEPTAEIGQYGGRWRTWLHGVGSAYMFITQVGYEPLIRWDPEWNDVIPNIAESWEVRADGAEYVFTLREGMKWSDGEPFTADDLVFAYDDVLSNPDLYAAVPAEFMVDQQPASLEKIDDVTVRFVFSEPNGLFLDRLATPRRDILSPRHYMEQFHAKYNDDVDQLAAAEGFDSWIDLFNFKNDTDAEWQNPQRPVLDPWVVVTPPSDASGQAEFERNPYYWKVDPDGSQLPYLDEVTYDIVAELEVALLSTTSGEVDLNHPHYAATVCTPENKPVLAQSRDEGEYQFLDSTSSLMNQMIIAFNLVHEDEAMREMFQNTLFRIGLSHAIDRQELIDTVFQRQGEPWQAAPRPDSDFFHEELAKQYTEYDVDAAEEYLDRAGFAERDADGFRLRPDGERIAFNVDVVTEMPELIAALELVAEKWAAVGVDIRPNTMDRTLFRERNAGNLHDALVWTGDGGWGDELLEPLWYFPRHALSYFAIPWGQWYATAGESGQQPPPPAQQQMDLYNQLITTIDPDEQRELFMRILDIAQEEFWAIGTVLDETAYGTVKTTFHNVPEWMPGSWYYPSPGPTRPEQYWTSAS